MSDLKYRKPTKAQIKTMRRIGNFGPQNIYQPHVGSVKACLRRGWIYKYRHEGVTLYDLTPDGYDVLVAWSDQP